MFASSSCNEQDTWIEKTVENQSVFMKTGETGPVSPVFSKPAGEFEIFKRF
jgi:hypothetical protein